MMVLLFSFFINKTQENYILEIRGKEYIRRIFHNVQYTQYEKDKLADFEEAIEKEKIILPAE